MKRLLSLVLTALLLLHGCAADTAMNPPAADPGLISAPDLLEQLLLAVPEGDEAPQLVAEEELPAYLLLYGIDPALVKSCAIARLGGSRVFELAVLDLASPSPAAEESLLHYQRSRQGDFTGYAPQQADIAKNGQVFSVEGSFRLILALTEDPDAVSVALFAVGYTVVTAVETPLVTAEPATPTAGTEMPVVSTSPAVEPSVEPTPDFVLPAGWQPYTPPHTDDMTIYDTSALLTAWSNGTPEQLNEKDRAVYLACRDILTHIITEDMSAYEKEWAVYSWLTRNVSYDWRHNDPTQTAPEESYQPYGAIVLREAVCLGYATAFQLFMDLLQIECITVLGASFDSTADHAWNMVNLNGQWYCVDATWDENRWSSPGQCVYFNVTSDRMAQSNHQWDYALTPMATATDRGKG